MNLDIFIRRGEMSNEERPLTIEEFDDSFQNSEPVYGVCRDAVNKRITVTFRGTDTLSFWSNWKSNFSIKQKKGIVPEAIKEDLGDDELSFHSGFYSKLNDLNIVTILLKSSISIFSVI